MIAGVIRGRYLLALALTGLAAASAGAHDLERTQVALTFAADGTFVLDISNDPGWLLLRLESFAGGQPPPPIPAAARDRRLAQLSAVFIDRVVLFVDGHEVRPESAEYLPPRVQPAAVARPPLATFRLYGRMPAEARTLRWLYGLVIDPYPLTVRRADGRARTEWIEGSNWSDTFDLSGQFRQATMLEVMRLPKGIGADFVVLAVFLVALSWRWVSRP